MEANNTEEYVLILEDRSAVKNEQEVGELSVVSEIDEKGNLKTVPPLASHQKAFLKFKNNETMLHNFMSNFIKQFKDPSRIGLYKTVSENIEKNVQSLKEKIQANSPELVETKIHIEDFLPVQKNATAIDPEKVDWHQLEQIGLSREKLEGTKELNNLLNWQKTDLLTIAIPLGETIIYTDARLALRTDNEGKIGLVIHPIRKEVQLDFPYMGHEFSLEEKEQLLSTGNLGKTIDLQPNNGDSFSAYVSIDQQTNELVALRADRVTIPQEIKGVRLSDEQYKDLVEGKSVKVEGMTSKNGKPFDAYLQVNAEKKGIEFQFKNGLEQDTKLRQGDGNFHKLCGVELSEKQREALKSGKSLYIKNMVNKEGEQFNAYVKLDKNRPRFYKWDPDKKQSKKEDQSKEDKVEKKSRGRKM